MGGGPTEDEDWRLREPDPEPPLWEEEPETPAWVRGLVPASTRPASGLALRPDFLRALCEAEDVLSRLDAGALAAPAAVREGLAARLAFREAAGWLAHAEAWVHPLDLALRDLGLTGSYAAAALSGKVRAALPATVTSGSVTGWTPEDPDTLPEDRVVGAAVAFARALRRLATASSWKPLASADMMAEALMPLGGVVGPSAFATWKAAWKGDAEAGPPLLAALAASGRWREVEAAREAQFSAEGRLIAGGEADRRQRAGLVVAAALAARSPPPTRRNRSHAERGLTGGDVCRRRRACQVSSLACIRFCLTPLRRRRRRPWAAYGTGIWALPSPGTR
jgi:hypothetical protein